MTFVPIVNLIAPPIFAAQAKKSYVGAVAAIKNREVNQEAASIVQDNLIPALSNFIKGLEKIAGFFQILETDLKRYNSNPDDETERNDYSAIHYEIIKGRCDNILEQLKVFDASLPAIRSTINSISNDESDTNYVHEWFTSKMDEIKREMSHQKIPQFFEKVKNSWLPPVLLALENDE